MVRRAGFASDSTSGSKCVGGKYVCKTLQALLLSWDIEGGRPKGGARQAELELGGHKVLKILWGGEGG